MEYFISQYGTRHKLFWDDGAKYGNGRKCLRAFEDGEPFLTASINLPNEELEENEMAIKDYSENNGILGYLIKAEIVSMPIRWVNSGHVQIPIVNYKGLNHLK